MDTIKVDLVEIKWGGVDWTVLAQDREIWRALVNAVMGETITGWVHNSWALE
jgi:predicted nucleotidyltransferase